VAVRCQRLRLLKRRKSGMQKWGKATPLLRRQQKVKGYDFDSHFRPHRRRLGPSRAAGFA